MTGITFEPDARPEISNLLGIYGSLLALQNPEIYDSMSFDDIMAECTDNFSTMDTKSFKSTLTELLVDTICPIGDEIRRLGNDEQYVRRVVSEGADHAREIAQRTMKDYYTLMKLQ